MFLYQLEASGWVLLEDYPGCKQVLLLGSDFAFATQCFQIVSLTALKVMLTVLLHVIKTMAPTRSYKVSK